MDKVMMMRRLMMSTTMAVILVVGINAALAKEAQPLICEGEITGRAALHIGKCTFFPPADKPVLDKCGSDPCRVVGYGRYYGTGSDGPEFKIEKVVWLQSCRHPYQIRCSENGASRRRQIKASFNISNTLDVRVALPLSARMGG
jgi:hypothetical protein